MVTVHGREQPQISPMDTDGGMQHLWFSDVLSYQHPIRIVENYLADPQQLQVCLGPARVVSLPGPHPALPPAGSLGVAQVRTCAGPRRTCESSHPRQTRRPSWPVQMPPLRSRSVLRT